MTRFLSGTMLGFVCFFETCSLFAAEPVPTTKADPKAAAIDLKEFRTVEKAIPAEFLAATLGHGGVTGYLGIAVRRNEGGLLVVEEVQPDSPATKAGIQKGDRVLRIDDHAVKTPDTFRELLQTHGPNDSVKLALERAGKPVEATALLAATSRPMKTGGRAAYLGVELGEAKEGEGVRLQRVTTGSPADAAGLKAGDRIVKINGAEFARAAGLDAVLSEKKVGEVLAIAVVRDGKELQLKATLGERGRDGSRDAGPPLPWRKDLFRLAVVCIEFPDVKHNGKVSTKEWADSFFSRSSYTGKMNGTGQAVFGSMNDYFHEQSAGAFRVEGKVFEWVEAGKKRNDYVQGSGTSNKTVLLVEALEKVTKRDGVDALKRFDGFLFIYAGARVNTNAGSLYYPHTGQVSFQSRRHLYLLAAEGGTRMSPIGAFVKEFGQALGLPDLAARPENRGSEGLGVWCAMSDTLGNDRADRRDRATPSSGRPQHLSAWSKEKLGWIKPTVIDPTVRQKLILAPIEDAPKECFKVLVRPDGSEYFLLENRRKKGFDADLPGEGLLIWRVVHDRPILEESHGVEGPTGPTVHLSAVPYPSASNNSFTPDSVPSSRSPLGGGLPVHITEIRRLPDGRITFQIGYEYR